MRRLRRILLNAATGLSLLLCVATVVLWVRSYRITDRLEVGTGVRQRGAAGATDSRMADLSSVPGRLNLFYLYTFADWGGISNVTPAGVHRSAAAADRDALWRLGAPNGFRFTRRVDRVSGNGYNGLLIVVVPHWFVAALAAVLPAVRGCVCCRRRRARPAGFCPACGYDLRATPDRCPECGHPPS